MKPTALALICLLPACLRLGAVPAAAQEDSPSQAPRIDAARELMMQARASPPQAEALLDQAQSLLQSAAATLPAGSLERLSMEVEQVDVTLLAAQPRAQRLVWLLGSAEDRRALAGLAGDLAGRTDDLARRTAVALEDARQDLRRLVTEASGLEELSERARYQSAWAHFYKALAAEQDSAEDLQQAAERIDPFTHQEGEVAAWSRLLAGQCQRRLGQADAARRQFEAVASQGPAAAAAVARFERVLADIESAADMASLEAVGGEIEAFRSAAAAGDSPVQADLKASLLQERWVLRQAERARDEPTRWRRKVEARRALMGPLMRLADPAAHEQVLTALAWREAADGPVEAPADSLDLLLRAVRLGQDATALAALEAVLDHADELSPTTGPSALWRMGVLLGGKGRLLESARVLARLGREFPDGPLAAQAWEQSARQIQHLTELQQPSQAPELRQEYVEIIEQLLAADPQQTGSWAYELGAQYEQLAATASPDRASALLAKAIAAYERLPVDVPIPQPARLRALELRAAGLLEAPSLDVPSAAGLVDQLHQQVKLAQEAVRPDGSRDEATRQHAARAEFWIARLLYEMPGCRQQSLDRLRSVRRDYAGTEGARRSAEFEVGLLLEQGRLPEAAQVVKDLPAEAFAQSRQIVHLVLERMRQRLEGRWSQPQTATDSHDLCGEYLLLARRLYEPLAQEPIERRYAATQFMADALLELGRPQEALELLEQCQAHDRHRLSQSAPSDGPAATDARNLQGLARAHRAMGRYEQALEYYRRLTDGLSPASWPGEYWRAELEYARCVVEAAAGDAQAMRNLGVRIRQLRMQDEGMGGLAEAFGQLERQAKDLAGESAR